LRAQCIKIACWDSDTGVFLCIW